MSYATQSSSYREMEIHAASPHKLVVIVFEQLVVNLERARIAMERNDIELRVTSLRRARDIVTEPIRLEDGWVSIPQGSGSGITIDADWLDSVTTSRVELRP